MKSSGCVKKAFSISTPPMIAMGCVRKMSISDLDELDRAFPPPAEPQPLAML
jgi:hypothetical protein